MSLVFSNDIALSLIFDDSLTIFLSQVCFGLLALGLSTANIGFWHLTSGSIVFQALFFNLISFSEIADFNKEASSLTFDYWIYQM